MTEQTTTAPALVPSPSPGRTAVRQLARLEAGRMLRHPAPWLGVLLTGYWGRESLDADWASADYQGLVAALAPLLLGISLAAMSAFGRQRVPLAAEAPMSQGRRAVAYLAGGLPLVGLAALVVAAATLWLRWRGGLPLGDEPGHTEHAHYTLPELLQPVVLAAFAAALGAAAVHVLRQRIVAAIVLVVGWFLVGATYWLFNGPVARWLTPLQVQPVQVEVAPASADPTQFPSSWLLSAPGEFQDHWARLVVSPGLAASHDVYVVGLTALAVAVAVPGRVRRVLLPVGAALAVLGVVLQWLVSP